MFDLSKSVALEWALGCANQNFLTVREVLKDDGMTSEVSWCLFVVPTIIQQ
jgi:hypothetical protein